MKSNELEELMLAIKLKCISENINMLTTYKLLQIVKDLLKEKN